MDEIKKIVIDEFSSREVQGQYEAMTRKGLWKSEKKVFAKYFPAEAKILDIGCGSGRTSFGLARLGYNVTAVDLVPAMIETAKHLQKEFKTKIDFRVGDAAALEFAGGSFGGALFSFNGWNQIPGAKNRQKALDETFRVLKRGACFVFTTHTRNFFCKYFFEWLKNWLRFFVLKPLGFKIWEKDFGDKLFTRARSGTFNKPQFIHVPSESEVKAQVEKAGFEIILCGWKDNIDARDSLDNTTGTNTLFFVCRKK